jgi:hypothetical protein
MDRLGSAVQFRMLISPRGAASIRYHAVCEGRNADRLVILEMGRQAPPLLMYAWLLFFWLKTKTGVRTSHPSEIQGLRFGPFFGFGPGSRSCRE